jgi:hypothetical protein
MTAIVLIPVVPTESFKVDVIGHESISSLIK